MTAGPRCFSDRDGRPVARRPCVALRDSQATGDEFVEYRLIGLEPRRPLPQIRDPELCAERGLPVVERAGAHSAWRGDLVVRMDDVVDLDERLRTRRDDVVVCESGVFEPVQIELMGVDAGNAVDHPLGDGACNTRGVCDPHGLGDPESLEAAVFSDDGVSVGGEREDAVEAVVDLPCREFWYERDGLVPGFGEIVWREHQFRRHLLERDGRVVVECVDVARHRAMTVVADTEAVAVLPVVEVAVLMAQDRQRGLCDSRIGAVARFERRGVCVLMRHRDEGDGEPDAAAELSAPETCAAHHDVGVDDPGRGADATYLTVAFDDIDHLGVRDEPRTT